LQTNKEIHALFQLIDDPDEEVFSTVSKKILSYGKGIIPNLEMYWEQTNDITTQERIEWLVHKVHSGELETEFINWVNDSERDLLYGAVLASKYIFPEQNQLLIYQELEKIRRSIWLELNSYLTPMEKVLVIHKVLYKYFRVTGIELNYQHPEQFTLYKALETKSANNFPLGLLYQSLAKLLDLPIYTIKIPNQNLLIYSREDIDINFINKNEAPPQSIFFIDPLHGGVYDEAALKTYMDKINKPLTKEVLMPYSSTELIAKNLFELSKCFKQKESTSYKYNELLHFIDVLNKD
jgi:regulator of sirC expression with transglutaminase-like and TPR domain